MRSRCLVKTSNNYKFYGGRGITICPEWDDYPTFLRDMGPCPEGQTLDRKESTGNYEPSNCRWATWLAQHNNTRRNLFFDYEGERLTLSQIAKKTGANYQRLYSLVKRNGVTIEQALEQVTQH